MKSAASLAVSQRRSFRGGDVPVSMDAQTKSGMFHMQHENTRRGRDVPAGIMLGTKRGCPGTMEVRTVHTIPRKDRAMIVREKRGKRKHRK